MGASGQNLLQGSQIPNLANRPRGQQSVAPVNNTRLPSFAEDIVDVSQQPITADGPDTPNVQADLINGVVIPRIDAHNQPQSGSSSGGILGGLLDAVTQNMGKKAPASGSNAPKERQFSFLGEAPVEAEQPSGILPLILALAGAGSNAAGALSGRSPDAGSSLLQLSAQLQSQGMKKADADRAAKQRIQDMSKVKKDSKQAFDRAKGITNPELRQVAMSLAEQGKADESLSLSVRSELSDQSNAREDARFEKRAAATDAAAEKKSKKVIQTRQTELANAITRVQKLKSQGFSGRAVRSPLAGLKLSEDKEKSILNAIEQGVPVADIVGQDLEARRQELLAKAQGK